jgi:hypothetical protein
MTPPRNGDETRTDTETEAGLSMSPRVRSDPKRNAGRAADGTSAERPVEGETSVRWNGAGTVLRAAPARRRWPSNVRADARRGNNQTTAAIRGAINSAALRAA